MKTANVIFSILLVSWSALAQQLSDSGVSEESKKIISEFESFYRPTIEASGFKFNIDIKEEANIEEASANNDGKNMSITVSTAFLQNARLSSDGLRFTLCHEMGHLLGGAPRRNVPFDWDGPAANDGKSLMSSEGEADYYAARICFREFVKNQNHSAELKKSKPSVQLMNQCGGVWGKDSEESFVCERLGLGAYNMLQLSKDFEISFDTPSKEIVTKSIIDNYPSRQCRLDTALAGALCIQKISKVFDFTNSEGTECKQASGARPACWYFKGL